jgi:DnaK suppressor protein
MDTEHARRRLGEERTRIERALAGLGPEETGEEADEQDPSNLASELADAELNEGLADELRDHLAAIDRAEQRLNDGTYGRSVVSGEPIPEARLEAVPWADRTVDEEAQG